MEAGSDTYKYVNKVSFKVIILAIPSFKNASNAFILELEIFFQEFNSI